MHTSHPCDRALPSQDYLCEATVSLAPMKKIPGLNLNVPLVKIQRKRTRGQVEEVEQLSAFGCSHHSSVDPSGSGKGTIALKVLFIPERAKRADDRPSTVTREFTAEELQAREKLGVASSRQQKLELASLQRPAGAPITVVRERIQREHGVGFPKAPRSSGAAAPQAASPQTRAYSSGGGALQVTSRTSGPLIGAPTAGAAQEKPRWQARSAGTWQPPRLLSTPTSTPTSTPASTVNSRQPPDEPAELLCPITGLMFRDPVVILTGHTYERTALTEYWRRRPLLNPMGSDRVESAKMICNFGCRQAVDAWLARHPDVLPGGWETRDISSDSRLSQPQLDALAVSIEAAYKRASREGNWGPAARPAQKQARPAGPPAASSAKGGPIGAAAKVLQRIPSFQRGASTPPPPRAARAAPLAPLDAAPLPSRVQSLQAGGGGGRRPLQRGASAAAPTALHLEEKRRLKLEATVYRILGSGGALRLQGEQVERAMSLMDRGELDAAQAVLDQISGVQQNGSELWPELPDDGAPRAPRRIGPEGDRAQWL